MRQRIEDLEILGKYEQPRILLIDQLAHCHISLQAGKDHYAVQSWSVEDVERLVIWLGMWLAAETGNATFEAECAALRTQNYNLRVALAATVQRAETAEAESARVDEYASYYAIAWESFEADSDGPEPWGFAEWLARQGEVQP